MLRAKHLRAQRINSYLGNKIECNDRAEHRNGGLLRAVHGNAVPNIVRNAVADISLKAEDEQFKTEVI